MLRCACVLTMIWNAATEMPPERVNLKPAEPVKLIFDTDIGNDVDDALALGVIHALQSRGECELLAVTITKDHEMCAPLVDAINTFYGRGGIPIGVTHSGITTQDSKFLGLARIEDDGALRYPHSLQSGTDAPDAVTLLRQVLAAQPDQSVAIAQVGFSTNLAALLDTPPDDISPLSGHELAAAKVRVLSIMAGAFELIHGKKHPEYNVVMDVPAAQKLVDHWPTPNMCSGYEIGLAITYPAESVERDFSYTAHHPLAEAYQLYNPTPHERPTWDLTSVLWAVRPERGYFKLSNPGRIRFDEKGLTTFEESPDGNHRYLIADAVQAARVREALTLLASQPPDQR